MLIVCPSCASRYEIDPSKLGTGGRKVRCPSCSFEWLAHGEGALSTDVTAMDVLPPEPQFDSTPPEQAPVEAMFEAEAMLPGQIERADTAQEWVRAEELDRSASTTPEQEDATAGMDAAAAWDRLAKSEDGKSEVDGETTAVPAIAAKKIAKAKTAKPKRSFSFSLDPMIIISRTVQAFFKPSGIAVAGVAMLALMIVERKEAVRLVPQTAGLFSMIGLPVNLQGLAFEKISTELIEDAKSRFLIVQGEIRNVTKETVTVPLIEIVVQDSSVKSLYTWTAEPSRPSLGAADTMTFRTRLASPPQNGSRVTVRFGAEKTAAKAEQTTAQ